MHASTAGRRTKWDLKREASHDSLVRSAMRVFHEKGYARATVADIVAGTGYTAGAFYHHFASKTDCFWHVIEHRERSRGSWADLARAADPSTRSLPDLLGQVFGRFAEAHEGLGAWVLVMVDFAQQHRGDPEQRERLAAVYVAWRDEIVEFVEALQEGGWVDRGRDARRLATQIFACGEGHVVHASLYGPDPLIAEALLDSIVRLLVGPVGIEPTTEGL